MTMHKTALTKFVRILEDKRARDPDPRDIREFVLESRFTPWSVGFKRGNLTKAFSANLPSLFPNLVSIDDALFAQDGKILLYGAIVEDENLSHRSTQRALQEASPTDEIVFFEMGFLASSHSWSQALQARDPGMACLGYVYEDIAHYYMSDYPNRLNRRLNGEIELEDDERRRARLLIDRIVRSKVSKYNSQPFHVSLPDSDAPRRVLVVDQNFSDASTIYGRASEQDFIQSFPRGSPLPPQAKIHSATIWRRFLQS